MNSLDSAGIGGDHQTNSDLVENRCVKFPDAAADTKLTSVSQIRETKAQAAAVLPGTQTFPARAAIVAELAKLCHDATGVSLTVLALK